MASPAGARPLVFDPVDTTFDAAAHAQRDAVESPSLSSSNALARFEFEAGHGKEGTKVLMVEWEEDATTKTVDAEWKISWDGKTTVLPARDQPDAQLEGTPINRLYFLLGPGVPVPTAVTLQKDTIVWKTNPLPAIFSPELGATARQAGKKGVLHTIWAKKRLQVLQREIGDESDANVEGVGLEMAKAEKDWIEQNFGVLSRPPNLNLASVIGNGHRGTLASPTSPRSPGGGRLMDKLKNLRLGTTSQDLGITVPDGTPLTPPSYPTHNPLSPDTSDVAVNSFDNFAAIKGRPAASNPAANASQPFSGRLVTAQMPPSSIAEQQRQAGPMASLNAVASGEPAAFQPSASPLIGGDDDDDDLFALPMSPRSPEMTQSPFSFAAQDTRRYQHIGPSS